MYASLVKNSITTAYPRNGRSLSMLKQMNALATSSNSTNALPRADYLMVEVFLRSFKVGNVKEMILPNFLSSPRTSSCIAWNSLSFLRIARDKAGMVTRTTWLLVVY